jgi:catalase
MHTFRLVNDQGESTFVKLHWIPQLGVHSLVWDEAQIIAGKDPDFHRKDLWEAIDKGAFPEYELALQLLPEKDKGKVPFDVLDPTKIWPEDPIPLQRGGSLFWIAILTIFRGDGRSSPPPRVIWYRESTCPTIRSLQGRLFSYLDTQLNRLGTPNFVPLPIDQPKSPVNNFSGKRQDALCKSCRQGELRTELFDGITKGSVGEDGRLRPLPLSRRRDQGIGA